MSYLCEGCEAYLWALVDREITALDPLFQKWSDCKRATTVGDKLTLLQTLRSSAALYSTQARAAIQTLINDVQRNREAGREHITAWEDEA